MVEIYTAVINSSSVENTPTQQLFKPTVHSVKQLDASRRRRKKGLNEVNYILIAIKMKARTPWWVRGKSACYEVTPDLSYAPLGREFNSPRKNEDRRSI